jgi:hypothetical protein
MGLLAPSRCLKSVIELLPPHVFHQYFPLALGGKVQRHSLIIPEYDELIQLEGWEVISKWKNTPFSVDLPVLETAMDRSGV